MIIQSISSDECFIVRKRKIVFFIFYSITLSLKLCNCSHQIGESFRKIYPILFQFEINFRFNYDMTIDCFLTKKDERSQLINN